jgi:DedD protein
MIRDFSKEELAPAENDTELTLGAGALFTLGGGLSLICAFCFGLGYAVGHRSSSAQSAANALPAAAASVAQDSKAPSGSGTKPGAAAQAPVQRDAQQAVDVQADGGAAGTAQVEQVGGVAGAGLSQPQVKPALDSQVRPSLGAQGGEVQPATAFQAQPASKQVQGWMVQIAAVSHPEDAEVLIGALRKHGYSVTAGRDANDNLIHVQTGPFVNRNDANAMRQKLLNDGYNAIVR